MTKLLAKVKQIPFQDTSKLSSIFKSEPNLGWDMVEKQCRIYTNSNINVEQINSLNSIYCKIVLRLNELQDPREKYFNNKMQKLMAEPFIIRCYNDFAEKKATNSDLMQKRKELEQKLSIENEKQNNHAFQHIIQSQNEKEKKLIQKIEQVIGSHEKKLQNRLQLRSMKKMLPIKKNSQDSILSSSELRNPQLSSPIKVNPYELSISEILSPMNSSSGSSRPLSQRTFNYKFSKINADEEMSDDDNSSEDEYQIQKRLKESCIQQGDNFNMKENR